MESQTVNGSTWTYTYNTDGMRTGRTNGTNSYEYIYNGSQLMRMVRNGVTVDFTYINGIPATISFNGNTFYYIVNGQGDVTGITDSNGNLQISYYYDAWGTPYYIYASGNTYASTLLTINPIMYRGYVFDRELGMYYLQSRYYVPQIGRFLNADDLAYLGADGTPISYNLFAYCGNNPVMGCDPYGTFDFWGFAKGVGRIVTGAVAVVAGVAVCIAGAPVAMIVAAGVTITAGVLTAVNGSADVQQSVTGDNFVRDTVFGGNQKAYDVYSGVTDIVACVGTAVCGNYLFNTCTMKGAVPGTEGSMSLEPGMTLDRYGSEFGRYLTDPGTHHSLLDLPASNSLQLNSYRVLKGFKVSTGIVANGGGSQYFSWMSVKRLIQFGFLELI